MLSQTRVLFGRIKKSIGDLAKPTWAKSKRVTGIVAEVKPGDQKEIETIIETAQKFADTDKKNLSETNLENEINTLCYQVDKNLADLEVSEELKQEALNLLEKVRTDLVNKNLQQLKVGVESLKLMLTQLQQAGQDDAKNAN
jgi:molecular chaperone DnaK (HSP70)